MSGFVSWDLVANGLFVLTSCFRSIMMGGVMFMMSGWTLITQTYTQLAGVKPPVTHWRFPHGSRNPNNHMVKSYAGFPAAVVKRKWTQVLYRFWPVLLAFLVGICLSTGVREPPATAQSTYPSSVPCKPISHARTTKYSFHNRFSFCCGLI